MKNKLMKLFNVVFAIIFIYIIVNAICFNININAWDYKAVPTVICILIYICIFILIYKYFKKKENINKKNIILLFAIVIFFQLIIGTLFKVVPAWDVRSLFTTGEFLLKGRLTSPIYFYRYKNNLAIEILLLGIFKISDIIKFINHYDLSMYINIILIDIAILFTYLSARKLYGENKAVVVLLFLIFMTPIYLYVPIIYTDTYTMLFPILIYYLYLKSNEKTDKSKILYYLLIAILAALGIIIKPTVGIIIVAILIMNLLYEKARYSISFLVIIGAILIITTSIFYSVAPKMVFKNWREEEYQSLRLPVCNWIMMGLNGTGDYNQRDYEKISQIDGYEAKKEFGRNLCIERLNNIKNNVGINRFLRNKLVYTWGEGTYFAQTALKIDPINKGEHHEYIIEKGKNTTIYKYFSQAQHLTMLILMVFAVINTKDRNKNTLKLTVFGVFLFFLIWETRSRYLINYIPIMALLSVEGLEQIVLIKNRIQGKIGNKKEKKGT